MASSRCRPAAPCRYRLRPAAAPRRKPHAASSRQAPRRQESISVTGYEAAGEANALLRSGPLRPAFEKEVLSSTFGFQAFPVPSRYGRRKPIPACRSRTEAERLNRGRKGLKFGRYFNHTAVMRQLFGFDAGPRIFLHHELG